jgi:hypothetical protein
MKETKEKKKNQWKDIPCSWIGRLNIKMSILFNMTYRYNAILIKTPNFYKNRKTTLNFILYNHKRPPKDKAILSKKNRVRGIWNISKKKLL